MIIRGLLLRKGSRYENEDRGRSLLTYGHLFPDTNTEMKKKEQTQKYTLQTSIPTEKVVNLSVFRIKNLLLGFIVLVFVTMVLDGLTFIFPFFFDLIFKMEAGETGLLLMIAPLAIIFVSPVSGYLSDIKGPRFVGVLSLLLLVMSTVMIVMFDSQTSYYYIIAAFILFGIALALFYTSNTTFVMNYAIKGKEGMMSALLAVVTYVGASFGIIVFEMVFSFKFDVHKLESLEAIKLSLIQDGYKNAMILGVIISVFGLGAIVIAKEKNAA